MSICILLLFMGTFISSLVRWGCASALICCNTLREVCRVVNNDVVKRRRVFSFFGVCSKRRRSRFFVIVVGRNVSLLRTCAWPLFWIGYERIVFCFLPICRFRVPLLSRQNRNFRRKIIFGRTCAASSNCKPAFIYKRSFNFVRHFPCPAFSPFFYVSISLFFFFQRGHVAGWAMQSATGIGGTIGLGAFNYYYFIFCYVTLCVYDTYLKIMVL